MPQPTSAGFVRSRTVLAAVACLSALAVLSLPSSAAAAGLLRRRRGRQDLERATSAQAAGLRPATGRPAACPATTPATVCIPGRDGQPAGDRDGLAGRTPGSIESSQPIQVTMGTLRITGTGQASLLHDDLTLADNTTLNNTGPLTIEGDLEWPEQLDDHRRRDERRSPPPAP